MNDPFVVDPPQLDLLLKQLRLPTMRTLWRSFTERADREGWSSARLLAALASQEVTDRERRRFERHRAEAKLPPGKTLDNFDFTLVPAVSKARVRVLASGDTWLEEGANALLFGPPGTGKSHLAAGLGLALVENGFRVLYQRTANLVQKLQAARRDLALEAAIRKLHKYHLLILDDFSYVTSESGDQRALRTHRRALREPLAPGDRQRALQRLGAGSSAATPRPWPPSTASSTAPTSSNSTSRATGAGRPSKPGGQRRGRPRTRSRREGRNRSDAATKPVPRLPQDRHKAKNAALSGAQSGPVARQATLRPL